MKEITLKTSTGMHLLVPIEMIKGKHAFTMKIARKVIENAAAVYINIGRG